MVSGVSHASPEAPPGTAGYRRGRYGLLLGATLASVAVQGICPPGGVQQVAVTVLAGACVVLALRAANVRRGFVIVVAAVVAVVVALAVVRAFVGGVGEGPARLMNALVVAIAPPVVALGVVRDLRATGHVELAAVMGVLALYILIGMTFAFTYGAIDNLGGEPFFANGGSATVSNCLYFSFTTLTTVGYGDFVSRSDLGHTLSVFEALIGQIYLVTVVSLIVSNLGQSARARRTVG
jgi:hypothetical protein